MANVNNYLILSNNKLVKEHFSQAKYYDEALLDLYIRVRDLIHKRHSLINHPLSGSIKPNQNPYRSFLLTSKALSKIDFKSLKALENSQQTVKKFLKDRSCPDWDESVLKDFRLLDLELLKSALE
jgi:hypothetical protein